MNKKIRIVGGIAVVTASADFHPLRQLKQLTKALVRISFDGTVLFDLFAVNGLAPNRFVSMRFCKNEFQRSSFEIESNVNPSIKIEQDTLAKCDESFLLGSVLSSSELAKFRH